MYGAAIQCDDERMTFGIPEYLRGAMFPAKVPRRLDHVHVAVQARLTRVLLSNRRERSVRVRSCCLHIDYLIPGTLMARCRF